MMRRFALSLFCAGSLFSAALVAQAPAVPVVVDYVQQKVLQRSLPFSGRVYSKRDANLSLSLAGELVHVVQAGVRVQTGDVLAELDSEPIRLRRKEVLARISRAESNLNYLRKDAERLATLSSSKVASERLRDEADNLRDLAVSDLAALRAQLQQLDDELRRSKLLAQFNGVVSERLLEAGEYLQAGAPILRLVDTQDLEIRFEMPVAQRGRITAGDSIRVSGAGESDSQANVSTVIPVADRNSQTFEVRAKLAKGNPQALIAGQLVAVNLAISSANKQMVVPRDALVLRTEGSYVYRINANNQAERVTVSVGEGEREWVVVSGALKIGERVAVRGVERLEDGQAVIPSKAKASQPRLLR